MTDKQPGIIDPPATVDDQFTLQTWMQQMTEAVRQGMGQIGGVGNAYVTYDALASGGFVTPTGLERSGSNNPIAGGYYQSNGGSASFDLTPPGKVLNLAVSALVGAVLIEWTPPALSYPHHFEIWRSTTGSEDDRVLIGSTSGLTYTDVNVDDSGSYTYWVRIAKVVGNQQVFGLFHSAEGTITSPKSTVDNILEIVSEDFYIQTPDGGKNPFTYLNLGTEAEPDWIVALRADVAIQGALAVSQLQSGELSENVTFSVGNGSVTIDTRTDGSGEIVITGSGGVESNDYLVLNQGRMSSYVWNGSEHVPYKEVRRMERGVASTGQQVTIPAWFKSQPAIYLSPFVIATYNPDYPSQGQQWRLTHSNVEPNPNQTGGWIFTPIAQLELTEGSSTQLYPQKTYNGSNNYYEIILPNRNSLKSCRINLSCISVRSTGQSGNFYNRRVTATVQYRVVGYTNWTTGGTQTLNLNQGNKSSGVLDLAVPATNNYDLRIIYEAADSGGTYSSGLQYEYTTREVFGESLYTIASRGDITIQLDAPTLSGWSVVKSEWSYAYNVTSNINPNHSFYHWGTLERPGMTPVEFRAKASLSGQVSAVANSYDNTCFIQFDSSASSYNYVRPVL